MYGFERGLHSPVDGQAASAYPTTAIAEREFDMSTQKSKIPKQDTIEHFLRERVKELSCLYGIASLIQQSGDSMDAILKGTVEIIPPSWQYPDITCARIQFEEFVYYSPEFRESDWVQKADIYIDGKNLGKVEVFYLEKMPDSDEGPFLKEERALIDNIAENLGRAFELIRTSKQLKREQHALQNMNIALHEVISKVQDEKEAISSRLTQKIDRLIIPLVHEIENRLPPEDRTYTDLLRKTLEEITSPFARKFSRALTRLTLVEIQICNMIKTGMSSKDIARLRHISPATVARHRERIRKKLGIAHQDVNLVSYLNSIMTDTV